MLLTPGSWLSSAVMRKSHDEGALAPVFLFVCMVMSWTLFYLVYERVLAWLRFASTWKAFSSNSVMLARTYLIYLGWKMWRVHRCINILYRILHNLNLKVENGEVFMQVLWFQHRILRSFFSYVRFSTDLMDLTILSGFDIRDCVCSCFLLHSC